MQWITLIIVQRLKKPYEKGTYMNKKAHSVSNEQTFLTWLNDKNKEGILYMLYTFLLYNVINEVTRCLSF